jgi:hypothetical protein
VLATKHAYERAVLKEKQKEQRESLKMQSAAFMSYEQWLRSLNMPEEAEKWRHRKNKRILLLERPNDVTGIEPQEHTGLSGFSMTVTRQGVKFTQRGHIECESFVDIGRVIKVYGQEDSTLLAALQLAQSKWGGVQVNGTEPYKRRCAELAAKHGIRVVNPELQEFLRTPEEKRKPPENSMNRYAMACKLGKKMLGKAIFAVTAAFGEREYSGLLLGVIKKEGRYYAAHCLLGERIFLHEVSKDDLPTLEALIGEEIDITSGDGHIKNIVDSRNRAERLDKKRRWSR